MAIAVESPVLTLGQFLDSPREKSPHPDLYKLVEQFKNPQPVKYERPKTATEMRIIEGILRFWPEFVYSYGGQALPITPEHIHVIDSAQLPPTLTEGPIVSKAAGVFFDEFQSVDVFSPTEPRLAFARHVVHELGHLGSLSQFIIEDGRLLLIRSGLRMYPYPEEVVPTTDHDVLLTHPISEASMNQVNEAVTEETGHAFDQLYFKQIPELAEDLALREVHMPPGMRRLQSFVKMEPEDGWERAQVYGSYASNRAELHIFAKVLRGLLPGEFESYEDIIFLFQRSLFSPRLDIIREIVDTAFGAGSFEILADMTKPLETTHYTAHFTFEKALSCNFQS